MSRTLRDSGFRWRLPITACLCGIFFLAGGRTFPTDEINTSYRVGDSTINVQIEAGPGQLSSQDLMQWVHWASDSVATYYGRFPVPEVRLAVIPRAGKGVRGGTTFAARDGGFIRIHVGDETTMTDLRDDWMLTHEMVHLAFPSMAKEHHWIEEGISTYVEPIARVRAGHLDAHEMWFELVRDLHQGLPQPGDRGLDNTHTWARTYWGGALFCFLADVEIHKRTGNRKGLDDALRGILNAGGDIRHDWQLKEALRLGDEATGVPVLLPLYDKMRDQPYDVDLPAIWKDLGVERTGDTVRFIDSAPLAKTRDAITRGETRDSAPYGAPGGN
ncbi:MAG: hypothetical protein WBR26_11625 [Candidatus Acidiferrum sp.]